MYRRIGLIVAAAAMGMLVAGTSAQAAQAAGPPVLTWSQGGTTIASYDYGLLDAGAGATKTVTFTLTNTGGSASGTLAVTLSGPAVFMVTADGCTGRSLGPRRGCGVTVEYAPTTSGERDSAALTATGEHASMSLPLTGESGTPNLKLSLPATSTGTDSNGTNDYSYWFGVVSSGTFVTLPFTVTNAGNGTANIGQLAGLVTGFTLSNDQTSNQNLAPGGTSTFDLTFSPNCTATTTTDMTLAVPSTTATAPPYISAAYNKATCVVPPITSLATATLTHAPPTISEGTGFPVLGILKNVGFAPTSPPARPLSGRLHGFTIQIPFTLPPGSTLNCDPSMIRDYSNGYPGGMCTVSGGVLTLTQVFAPLPPFYQNWIPGFNNNNKQIGWVHVGLVAPSPSEAITWGTPTVTAVS